MVYALYPVSISWGPARESILASLLEPQIKGET